MSDASYTQVTGKLDLIDRQAAIEWCLEGLNNLPSAEPERKKGKWIDYSEDGFVECSFCHSATNCEGNKDELHYCFCCGADMRGEQE